jgi:formylglycine-generating enzyme required for sulfatase activity
MNLRDSCTGRCGTGGAEVISLAAHEPSGGFPPGSGGRLGLVVAAVCMAACYSCSADSKAPSSLPDAVVDVVPVDARKCESDATHDGPADKESCPGGNCRNLPPRSACYDCDPNELCFPEGECPCLYDHCGDECCDPNELCEEGKCTCTPACVGKECGHDGCGGLCGDCGPELVCAAGTCAPDGTLLPVPGGDYWSGCNGNLVPWCLCPKPDDPPCMLYSGGCPYEKVFVDDFSVQVTEVTALRFALFLSSNGNSCSGHECWCESWLPDGLPYWDSSSVHMVEPGSWRAREGRERHPANRVTWYGARAYCESIGQRLCAWYEWEKAARGGCAQYADCALESRTYPWGNEPPNCDVTNYKYSCEDGVPVAVGSRPLDLSPYGVLQMGGNVTEWTSDGMVVEDDSDKPQAGGSFSGHPQSMVWPTWATFPDDCSFASGIRCCADGLEPEK